MSRAGTTSPGIRCAKTARGALPKELCLRPSERVAGQREARLRALLRGTSDCAVIETDTDGRITFWNEGAEALIGWTEAEATGRNVEMILRRKTARPASPNRSDGKRRPTADPTMSDGTCARTERDFAPMSA